MHWLVGIDEAGYGPNLGPLVQAATAICVDDPDACLWTKHAATVRRATEPNDGRIVIDDSKLIHIGPNKFQRLEANLQQVFPHSLSFDAIACGDSFADLEAEAWFVPLSRLCGRGVRGERLDSLQQRPSPPAPLPQSRERGEVHSLPQISFIRNVITSTPRFNQLVDRHGTKAAPLAVGVTALLQAAHTDLPDHPITFVIDKQGGRNYYAPMISTAFPDGWVRVLGEAGECSNYEVEGLGRPIRLTFRPKAERQCLPVAVASMLAKYLREVLMQQFNRYWLSHLKELAPTAGYPSDAKRFYAAILPVMERLKLSPDQVWRKK